VYEYQADDAVVDIMVDAGFDPNGLAALFDDLSIVIEPMGMLGTHPDPRNRATRVRSKIRRLGLMKDVPQIRNVLEFRERDGVGESKEP
jgi:predicted Zn-dependent protease